MSLLNLAAYIFRFSVGCNWQRMPPVLHKSYAMLHQYGDKVRRDEQLRWVCIACTRGILYPCKIRKSITLEMDNSTSFPAEPVKQDVHFVVHSGNVERGISN